MMFSFLQSLWTTASVNVKDEPANVNPKKKAKKSIEEEKPQHVQTKKTALHQVPSMWPVGKFDDLTSELSDIMESSNHCFTGFQFGLTSFINSNFMCGHMFHAGKKEENKF